MLHCAQMLQVLQKLEFCEQMVRFDCILANFFLLEWTFLFMSELKPEWPNGFPHSAAVLGKPKKGQLCLSLMSHAG